MNAITREIQELVPALEPGDARLEPAAVRLLAAQRAAIGQMDRFLDCPRDAPWWRQAVPTLLFRKQLLFAGAQPALTFASSGTTDPATRSRAAYSKDGLAWMASVIDRNAARMLFPDGRTTRILVLAPAPEQAPQMIMAWGMRRLIERFGLSGRFLVGPAGLDPAEVVRELTSAAVPVCLIGASFGFVHLLDGFAAKGVRLTLPPGSRVMHAGGFKGRSRSVEAAELAALIGLGLGVPSSHIVNLFGMTELASQFYEDGLAAHHEGRAPRAGKHTPPWARTLALDPATLEPVRAGEPGLLCHLDLGNLERPAAVRTDDVGRVLPGGGFEVLGRVRGTDERGCSLSLDDLLAS